MKTRLGMIGMGGIGRFHADYLVTHPDVELTAVCDIDQARLDDAARKYGARPFKDYRDMLGKTSLDAMYICVPPYVDGPLEIDCLVAGLPIFVEKPIALDMPTARKSNRRSSSPATSPRWDTTGGTWRPRTWPTRCWAMSRSVFSTASGLGACRRSSGGGGWP